MDKSDKDYRRERVRKIKKIILILIVIFLLLPTVLCLILFAKLNRLSDELDKIRQIKIERVFASERVKKEGDIAEFMQDKADSEGVYENSDGGRTDNFERLETESLPAKNGKKVYLTFDDGPGPNTDRILSILDDYKVKATFFVVGKTDENSIKHYKEIVEKGHTLGMHSYTHKFDEIYATKEAFKKDFYRIKKLLYDTTGVEPRFYRFPGGSSTTLCKTDMYGLIDFLNKKKVAYFDWNVECGDAVKVPLTAKKICRNVMSGVKDFDVSIVLMHDLPEKDTTVEALPKILEKLLKDGYEVLPIDDETLEIHHRVSREK